MKLTDDEIEALAKKHICPHHDRLDAILPNRVPYQQTEQFRRVKALIVDVLSKLRAPVAVEKLDEGNAPMPFKDHSMGPLTPVHDYTGSLIAQTLATARHGAYEGSIVWTRIRHGGEWTPWQVVGRKSAPVADERAAFKEWFDDHTIQARMNGHHVNDGLASAAWEERARRAALASAPAPFDRRQLRALVDLVWNEATESTAVPDTPWADRMIDKVFSSLPASAPVAGEAQPVAWGTTDDREPISDALKRAHPRYATAYTVPLFRYAAPQASEADPLQGAADWLVNAQEKFGPLDLSASLMIGYNRAQRLYDAAKKPKS